MKTRGAVLLWSRKKRISKMFSLLFSCQLWTLWSPWANLCSYNPFRLSDNKNFQKILFCDKNEKKSYRFCFVSEKILRSCAIWPCFLQIWSCLEMGPWITKRASHCLIQLFATPWTVACHAPLSVGFSRQEYWSGLPVPSLEDFPNPETEPRSPTLQADSLLSEPPGKPLN